MLKQIAPEELDSVTASGVVLLDFWQQSCPPCRMLEPRLEAFARRHRGELAAYRIDIDKDPETPRRFGIMSIPTLILFADGRELERLDGLIRDPDLEAALDRAGGGQAGKARLWL